MKGHVRGRGHHCWQIVVYLGKGSEGKKQYHREPFHGTKKQAEARAADIVSEVEKRQFVKPSPITVEEHFRRWLAYIQPPQVRESTYEMYEILSRVHIVPALGAVRLDRLSTMHILDFLKNLKAGSRKDGKGGRLSSSTVKHVYDVLHIAMKAAVDWHLLPANPMNGVEAPKVEEKEMAVWEPHQARAFLNAVRGDPYYPAYLLAISGGLRRGEILGLRWQDVDWENRRVAINQQVVKGEGGKRIQSELKTRRGRRSVTVSSEVLEALEERRTTQAAERAAYEGLYGAGTYSTLGLIFCNESGGPLNPDSFSSRFRDLVRKTGLPRLRLHDTRHTSATLMVAAGTHPRVMAERLGDRVETVMGMYAHALRDLQDQVADDIDRVLQATPEAGLPKDCHKPVQ